MTITRAEYDTARAKVNYCHCRDYDGSAYCDDCKKALAMVAQYRAEHPQRGKR